jgi:undecaprenyl-diphosphatase
VSSSGHLVILGETMDIEAPLIFNAMVHLGTLLVVIWVFRREVVNVFRASLEMLGDLRRGIPLSETMKEDEHHFAFMIFAGSIPTGIIGLLFRDPLESLYSNLGAVGIALIFTGTLLFMTRRIAPPQRHGIKEMRTSEAFLIGAMQGIAIIPGISRSGVTISSGMFVGLNRELVARYSFLLFIPAILGAFIIQLYTVISEDRAIEWAPTIVGAVTAMIVGYFTIHLLLRVIRTSTLHLFSFYCWALGLIVLYLSVS